MINAYGLKAIDVDIENTEFASATARQRVIDALKIIETNNPGIKTFLTFETSTTGPNATGQDLINRGAAAGLQLDGWVIMPFNFGGGTTNMGSLTTSAADGLKNRVKAAYGLTDDAAYRKIGISSMNGKTDQANELVRQTDFNTMLSYAQQHHLARLTFWGANRDRQCPGAYDGSSCSGISQSSWEFTKIFVKYTG